MNAVKNGNGNGHGEHLKLIEKVAQESPVPSEPGIRESAVTFQTQEGLQLKAHPIKISRHAVVFELYNPVAPPRLSEVLDTFKVVLQDRTVYSGQAVIRNVLTAGQNAICEATLAEKSWMDVDHNGLLQQPGRFKAEYQSFLEEWQKTYKVSSEYKIIVADMQTFFTDLRIWLEQIEVGIRSMPSGSRVQLEEDVTRELARLILPSIDDLFEKFEEIAKGIEEDQRPANESYMRRHLHSLLLGAPFAHRTFYKPLGYAGDYEMVNMIARNGQEGGSLFAKVVNCWFLKQPPAEAHRNRLAYLAEQLEQEALRVSQEQRKARVYNFACGPAVEVQNFFKYSLLSEQIELTLADFNAETLQYISEIINNIGRQSGRKFSVQTQKKTVHQLIKESLKPIVSGNGAKREYDFVYCAGLFDYLSNHTCKQMMDIFYDLLAPGGLLVATNVETSNPLRYGMSYLLDWHLVYRTAQEMRTLKPKGASDDDTVIRTDDTGVNVFLEIRKPTHG